MKHNNNIKVIIIEDEQDILSLYREFLLMNGYFIIFTDTKATNVLKEYEKHKPDIIILDHNIEGEKNGIEASKDILNSFPHASILVMSALDSIEQTFYDERVFKDKKIDLLIKPIKLQMLEKHIKLLLNN